jgi:hypothetical protein
MVDQPLMLVPADVIGDESTLTINDTNQVAFGLYAVDDIRVLSMQIFVSNVLGSLSSSHILCEIMRGEPPVGLPDNDILASATLVGNPVIGLNEFSFGSSGYLLQQGGLYWFRVRNIHPSSTTNNIQVVYALGGLSTLHGGDGGLVRSSLVSGDGGRSWSYSGAIRCAVFNFEDGISIGSIIREPAEVPFDQGDSVGLKVQPSVLTTVRGIVLGFQRGEPKPGDRLEMVIYDGNLSVLWSSHAAPIFSSTVKFPYGLMKFVDSKGYTLLPWRTYFVTARRASGTSELAVSSRTLHSGQHFQIESGFYPVHITPSLSVSYLYEVLSFGIYADSFRTERFPVSSINRGVW